MKVNQYKFQNYGEPEPEPIPIAKPKLAPVKMPTFYGPSSEECVYGDCSKWVTDTSTKLYGVNRDLGAPEDAWYKRAKALNAGGVEVFNRQTNPTLNKADLKIGDNVTMHGSGTFRKNLKSKTGLPMSDNFSNSHVGMIVGSAENTGEPLVRHRVGNRIKVDTLTTGNMDALGINSIFRPKAFIDKVPDVSGDPLYNKYDGAAKLINHINPDTPNIVAGDDKKGTWYKNANRFTEAINRNVNDVGEKSGLTPEEMDVVGKISLGIFGTESSFDTSLKRKPKEILKRAWYNLTSPFTKKVSPASVGPTRIKYDWDVKNADGTQTDLGKEYMANGITNNDLEDYDKSATATMVRLSNKYKKLKRHKTYDSAAGTVYDGVPIESALIDQWSRGSTNKKRRELLKKRQSDYVNSVYDNMSITLGNAVFPRTIEEIVMPVLKKK